MYHEDYQMTTQRLCVFDCTKAPYKVVAKYRDNEIKPVTLSKHHRKSCETLQ